MRYSEGHKEETRRRILKVAARIVVSARRVVFHLASSYPFRDRFRAIFERVISTPLPARANLGFRMVA